jgi:hypothetical protein
MYLGNNVTWNFCEHIIPASIVPVGTAMVLTLEAPFTMATCSRALAFVSPTITITVRGTAVPMFCMQSHCEIGMTPEKASFVASCDTGPNVTRRRAGSKRWAARSNRISTMARQYLTCGPVGSAAISFGARDRYQGKVKPVYVTSLASNPKCQARNSLLEHIGVGTCQHNDLTYDSPQALEGLATPQKSPNESGWVCRTPISSRRRSQPTHGSSVICHRVKPADTSRCSTWC